MSHSRFTSRMSSALVALAAICLLSAGSAASGSPAPAARSVAPPIGGPTGAPEVQGRGASPAGVLPAVQTQASLESHFVALSPCRIVDTRSGGGIMTTNAVRNFYVAGTFGFAPQGGKSGGCGVPIGASAVAVNVTTNASTNFGYLVGWAAGTAVTTSNFTSYRTGENITANPVLPLAKVTTQQLSLKAVGGSTQVIMDVSGYYIDQIEGLIYTGASTSPGSGFVYSGSPRLLSVTWVQAGIADVTIDRDVTYCTPVAGGYYDSAYSANAKAFTGNKIRVFSFFTDPGTHVISPTNNYVYLTVSC